MKLLIAAVAFATTLGMLFLIENNRTPKQDYAQIIEVLKEGDINAVVSATPLPTKIRTPIPTPTPVPQNSSAAGQTSTPTPIQTSTKTPSLTLPPISPSPSPALSMIPAPTPTPSSPPQETGQGFINIVSITSPVKQNDNAQVSIATTVGASCSIKVVLPSGNPSSNKNLVDKISDISGNVSWSWGINWNTTPGTANIDITCSKDGQNFSKSLQMTIVER